MPTLLQSEQPNAKLKIMPTETKTEIKIAPNAVVMPAVTGNEALEIWAQYQDLINKICLKEDYQDFKINNEIKKFCKKSGWRKIATFFNLSIAIIEERQESIGQTVVWHFTIQAIAPSGRFAVGTGSCDIYEKAQIREGKYLCWNKWTKKWEIAQPNSIHNIRTTAETRATNRAISNLVGGGEVSADEIINTVDMPEEKFYNFQESSPIGKLSSLFFCADCEVANIRMPISQAENNYSINKFGRPLCRKCQTKLN